MNMASAGCIAHEESACSELHADMGDDEVEEEVEQVLLTAAQKLSSAAQNTFPPQPSSAALPAAGRVSRPATGKGLSSLISPLAMFAGSGSTRAAALSASATRQTGKYVRHPAAGVASPGDGVHADTADGCMHDAAAAPPLFTPSTSRGKKTRAPGGGSAGPHATASDTASASRRSRHASGPDDCCGGGTAGDDVTGIGSDDAHTSASPCHFTLEGVTLPASGSRHARDGRVGSGGRGGSSASRVGAVPFPSPPPPTSMLRESITAGCIPAVVTDLSRVLEYARSFPSAELVAVAKWFNHAVAQNQAAAVMRAVCNAEATELAAVDKYACAAIDQMKLLADCIAAWETAPFREMETMPYMGSIGEQTRHVFLEKAKTMLWYKHARRVFQRGPSYTMTFVGYMGEMMPRILYEAHALFASAHFGSRREFADGVVRLLSTNDDVRLPAFTVDSRWIRGDGINVLLDLHGAFTVSMEHPEEFALRRQLDTSDALHDDAADIGDFATNGFGDPSADGDAPDVLQMTCRTSGQPMYAARALALSPRVYVPGLSFVQGDDANARATEAVRHLFRRGLVTAIDKHPDTIRVVQRILGAMLMPPCLRRDKWRMLIVASGAWPREGLSPAVEGIASDEHPVAVFCRTFLGMCVTDRTDVADYSTVFEYAHEYVCWLVTDARGELTGAQKQWAVRALALNFIIVLRSPTSYPAAMAMKELVPHRLNAIRLHSGLGVNYEDRQLGVATGAQAPPRHSRFAGGVRKGAGSSKASRGSASVGGSPARVPLACPFPAFQFGTPDSTPDRGAGSGDDAGAGSAFPGTSRLLARMRVESVVDGDNDDDDGAAGAAGSAAGNDADAEGECAATAEEGVRVPNASTTGNVGSATGHASGTRGQGSGGVHEGVEGVRDSNGDVSYCGRDDTGTDTMEDAGSGSPVSSAQGVSGSGNLSASAMMDNLRRYAMVGCLAAYHASEYALNCGSPLTGRAGTTLRLNACAGAVGAQALVEEMLQSRCGLMLTPSTVKGTAPADVLRQFNLYQKERGYKYDAHNLALEMEHVIAAAATVQNMEKLQMRPVCVDSGQYLFLDVCDIDEPACGAP